MEHRKEPLDLELGDTVHLARRGHDPDLPWDEGEVITRNSCRWPVCRCCSRLRYRANRADRAAWERTRRPKICKLVEKRELAQIVALNLKKLWSPEQIAGWLKRTYPDEENFQVSDETLYKSLFI